MRSRVLLLIAVVQLSGCSLFNKPKGGDGDGDGQQPVAVSEEEAATFLPLNLEVDVLGSGLALQPGDHFKLTAHGLPEEASQLFKAGPKKLRVIKTVGTAVEISDGPMLTAEEMAGTLSLKIEPASAKFVVEITISQVTSEGENPLLSTLEVLDGSEKTSKINTATTVATKLLKKDGKTVMIVDSIDQHKQMADELQPTADNFIKNLIGTASLGIGQIISATETVIKNELATDEALQTSIFTMVASVVKTVNTAILAAGGDSSSAIMIDFVEAMKNIIAEVKTEKKALQTFVDSNLSEDAKQEFKEKLDKELVVSANLDKINDGVQTGDSKLPVALSIAGPANLKIGECGTYAIGLTDENGDATDAPSKTVITASIDSTSGGVFADNKCTQTGNPSIAAGAGTISVFVLVSKPSTVKLSATAETLVGAESNINVAVGVATALTLDVADQIAAGDCIDITVQATDAYGNLAGVGQDTLIDLDDNGQGSFWEVCPTIAKEEVSSDESSSANPIGEFTISAGDDTLAVKYRNTVAGSVTLTAAGSGLTAASAITSITPGESANLVITGPEVIPLASCSIALYAKRVDEFQNELPADTEMNLSLGTNSWSFGAASLYSDANCSSSVSSVTIAAGESQSEAFYLKYDRPGAVYISLGDQDYAYRVQPDYEPLYTLDRIGVPGEGLGEFFSIEGIAVSDEYIYVNEWSHNRLHRIALDESSAEYLIQTSADPTSQSWSFVTDDSTSQKEGDLSNWFRVLDDETLLFLNSTELLEIDSSAAMTTAAGGPQDTALLFDIHPTTGDYYVLDNDVVKVYTRSTGALSATYNAVTFSNASQIAVASNGDTFIYDEPVGDPRITKLDGAGAQSAQWTPPRGDMRVDGSSVYVYTSGNTVLEYDLNGNVTNGYTVKYLPEDDSVASANEDGAFDKAAQDSACCETPDYATGPSDRMAIKDGKLYLTNTSDRTIEVFSVTATKPTSYPEAPTVKGQAIRILTDDTSDNTLGLESQIVLSWPAVRDARRYRIYRSESENGTYMQISRNNHETNTYTDTDIEDGTTYYYKVAAENAFGTGSDSNTLTILPQAIPSVLTIASFQFGIHARGTGNGEFDWDSGAGALAAGNSTLYVGDFGNGRIQRFNMNGVFLDWIGDDGSSGWGTYTTGTAQPINNYESGFVALDDGSSVSLYFQNSNGLQKASDTTLGSALTGDLNSYYDRIKVNGSTIYIETDDPFAIGKYSDTDGSSSGRLGAYGLDNGEWTNNDIDLEFDSNGNAYVLTRSPTHSRHMVIKFDSSDTFVTSWVVPIWSNDLAIDENDRLYAGSTYLYQYDVDGNLLDVIWATAPYESIYGKGESSSYGNGGERMIVHAGKIFNYSNGRLMSWDMAGNAPASAPGAPTDIAAVSFTSVEEVLPQQEGGDDVDIPEQWQNELRPVVYLSFDIDILTQGVKVLRSDDGGSNYEVINAGSENATWQSFKDNTVTAGNTYYYKLVAVNPAGDSTETSPISIAVADVAATELPATPSSFGSDVFSTNAESIAADGTDFWALEGDQIYRFDMTNFASAPDWLGYSSSTWAYYTSQTPGAANFQQSFTASAGNILMSEGGSNFKMYSSSGVESQVAVDYSMNVTPIFAGDGDIFAVINGDSYSIGKFSAADGSAVTAFGSSGVVGGSGIAGGQFPESIDAMGVDSSGKLYATSDNGNFTLVNVYNTDGTYSHSLTLPEGAFFVDGTDLYVLVGESLIYQFDSTGQQTGVWVFPGALDNGGDKADSGDECCGDGTSRIISGGLLLEIEGSQIEYYDLNP